MAAKNPQYKIGSSDKIDQIPKKFGHKDWKLIWQAPDNKSLVSKRGKPEKLQPGDMLSIPPNEKQLQEIAAKVADLNKDRDRCVKALPVIAEEKARVQRKVDALARIQADDDRFTAQIVTQLEGDLAGVKGVSQDVDVAAMLAQITVSLVKLSSLGLKAATASTEELAKINKESTKEVIKLATDTPKDVGTKELGTLKSNSTKALSYVGTAADWWDKLTSPSWWGYTYAEHKYNGKTWTEAAKMEIGQDIEEKIKEVKDGLDKRRKETQAQQNVLKAQLADCDTATAAFNKSIGDYEKQVANL